MKRLDFVMDQTVPIHGRGNFPTLYVKLKELIRLVKHKLQKEHSIEIRDVRLNGGASNFVLAPENSNYNDLDLIFGIDLSDEDRFDVIRDVVLECLKEFYPKEQQQATTTARSCRCCGNKNINQLSSHHAKESQFGTPTSARIHAHTRKPGQENKTIRQTCDKRQNNEKEEEDNDKLAVNGDIQQQQQQHGNNHSAANRLNETSEEEPKPSASGGGSANSCGKKTAEVREDSAARIKENRIGCEQINNGPAVVVNMGAAKQQMPLNNCAIKEAYVHKMVKVNDDDRWSLISLGVQQSEVTSCGQVNHQAGPIGPVEKFAHCASEKYFPALPPTAKNYEDCCGRDCEQQTGTGGNCCIGQQAADSIGVAYNRSTIVAAADHHNHHYHHHHQQQQNHLNQLQQHRPKQSPISIELKFVDRMRRKYEFSVDSFQIILDSLIQFYDYAPKPSAASQKNLMNSHPSSTVINTRPMIMSKRRCSADCCSTTSDCMAFNHRMESNFDGYSKVRVRRDNLGCQHRQSSRCRDHHSSSTTPSSLDNEFNTRCKTTNCVLAGPRSYYQFQLTAANSPPLTSEASSSGCSSSSSVVSSSSSSLSSCDEDHEDPYCDVDGQSSSSASTSSLLSSSVYSSDGGVVCQKSSAKEGGTNSRSKKQAQSSDKISQKRASSSNNTKSAVVESSKSLIVSKTTATEMVVTGEIIGEGCCVECCPGSNNDDVCDEDDNDDVDEYDFETDDSTSCAVISENFYPTVIGRSEYGSFKEALYHLERKLIATRSPEEIRGGGLLKYCNLLVKNYKPTNVYQIRTLERYMCSRFFIDFSDLNQQQAKLDSYLANHFSDDLMLKIDYLTILHNVVQRSTVCLMNHELRLTLEMIRDMASKMNEQQQQQQGRLNQTQHQRSAQLHSEVQSLEAAPAAQQPKPFFGNNHQQQPKPLLIQSGVYRVKLVNYSLAKPVATAAK